MSKLHRPPVKRPLFVCSESDTFLMNYFIYFAYLDSTHKTMYNYNKCQIRDAKQKEIREKLIKIIK